MNNVWHGDLHSKFQLVKVVWKMQVEIFLCTRVKCHLHCMDFCKTHNFPAGLRCSSQYWMWPKLVKTCRSCGKKFVCAPIKSLTLTVWILMTQLLNNILYGTVLLRLKNTGQDLWVGIYFRSWVKFSCHYMDFCQTHNCLTVLCVALLYWISPKSENNCENYG